MSLVPGSPPRTPGGSHTPLTPPHTPRTPTRHASGSIPRPPVSPLRRPASQASLPNVSTRDARRASGHGLPGSAPGAVVGLGLDTGVRQVGNAGGGSGSGTPQKTRARDLLRKHYGLGLGPPPPLSGAKSSQDPMDFGKSRFGCYVRLLLTVQTYAFGARIHESQTRRCSTHGGTMSS